MTLQEYFNVSINKIGFKIDGLKQETICDIDQEIGNIVKELDDLKEELLKKINWQNHED